MPKLKSQIYVAENNTVRPVCPSSIILLSNAQDVWQPIALEQHWFPAFEQPEVTTEGHIISLHLSEPIDFQHNMKGKWQCDRFNYQDISITPHHTTFNALWQKPIETIMLRLDADWLNTLAQENLNLQDWELDLRLGQQDILLYSLMLTVRNEVANGYQAGQLYSDSLLNTLGIHLLSKYIINPPQVDFEKEGLSQSQLRKAIAFIEDNYDRQLRLATIAQEIGLSQYYFERQFKKSMNMTPYQYLIHCRISRAKNLLSNSELKIAQIAQACGFSSQSYFTRQFRQHLGISPKAYRRLN